MKTIISNLNLLMFIIASIVFMVCLTGDKDLATMVYSGLAILLSSVILLLVELHTYSNNR